MRSAQTAPNNPLQQSSSLARRSVPILSVIVLIGRQPLLIGHELLPRDVSRKCILDADFPPVNREPHDAALRRSRTPARPVRFPAAIDIGSRISGILQYVPYIGRGRHSPDDLMRSWPVEHPAGDLQPLAA